MQIAITTHAVDQYLARVRPGETLTEEEHASARAYLEDASERAMKLPDKTPNGEEQWRIADAVFVVKRGRSQQQRIAVTLLRIGQVDRGRRWRSSGLLNAELVAEYGGEALGPPALPTPASPPTSARRQTPSEKRAHLIGAPPVLPMPSVEAADEYLRFAESRLVELRARLDVSKAVLDALANRIDGVKKWRAAQDGNPAEKDLTGPVLALPCEEAEVRAWLEEAAKRLGRLYGIKPSTDKVEKATRKLEGRVAHVRTYLRQQQAK